MGLNFFNSIKQTQRQTYPIAGSLIAYSESLVGKATCCAQDA